jgi:hypothetical protein
MIKMGANAIEEKMASLMNLEQEWRDEEDEDYREDLSDLKVLLKQCRKLLRGGRCCLFVTNAPISPGMLRALKN